MARPASTAVGGYFPLPLSYARLLAELLVHRKNDWVCNATQNLTFLDPCAGKGEAAVAIISHLNTVERAIGGRSTLRCNPVLVELERSRAMDAKLAVRQVDVETPIFTYAIFSEEGNCGVIHDDFLALQVRSRDEASRSGAGSGFGADVVYCNPPYDFVEGDRVEAMFLRHLYQFTHAATVLLFVIPESVFRHSSVADELRARWTTLAVYRMEPDDYKVFKQVFVIAVRKTERKVDLLDRLLAQSEYPVLTAEAAAKFSEMHDLIGDSYRYSNRAAGLPLWSVYRPIIDQSISSDWVPLLREGNAVVAQMDGLKGVAAVNVQPGHVALLMAGLGLVNGAVLDPNPEFADMPPVVIASTYGINLKKVAEKADEGGNIRSESFLEVPAIVMRVLVLKETPIIIEPISSTALSPSENREWTEFTMADILTRYSASLTAHVDAAIRPLYDMRKDRHITFARMRDGLELRTFQKEYLTGAFAALAERQRTRGRSPHPMLVWDVGTGKTPAALSYMLMLYLMHVDNKRGGNSPINLKHQLKAVLGVDNFSLPRPVRRVMVLCPPHLVESWVNECRKWLPIGRVVKIASIADVEQYARRRDPYKGFTVFILSRDRAKLGHRLRAINTATCPTCGTSIDSMMGCNPINEPEVFVKRRLRCTAPKMGETPDPRAALIQRIRRVFAIGYDDPRADNAVWISEEMTRLEAAFLSAIGQEEYLTPKSLEAICRIAAVAGMRSRKLATALLQAAELFDNNTGAGSRTVATVMETLPFLLASERDRTKALESVTGHPFRELVSKYPSLPHAMALADGDAAEGTARYLNAQYSANENNVVFIGDGGSTFVVGSVESVHYFTDKLSPFVVWGEHGTCNTPFFEADGTAVRRFPLASYITKKHPDFFDALIADEAHELANGGTAAQAMAAMSLVRIAEARSGVVLLLTGTISNSMMSHLHGMLFMAGGEYRRQLKYDESRKAVERYGYRIHTRSYDVNGGERGAVSERKSSGTRSADAPGIRPIAIGVHVLPSMTRVSSGDIPQEMLPPQTRHYVRVDMTVQQRLLVERVAERLVQAVRQDAFTRNAGALLGQLSRLPALCDNCTRDTGNGYGANWVVVHPRNGLIVINEPLLDIDHTTLLPKEVELVRIVAQSMARGNPIVVLTMSRKSGIQQRLQKIIARMTGETPVILDETSGAAVDRIAWIQRNFVEPNRMVLITHPRRIETGINNLTGAKAMVLFEPTSDTIVVRQVAGRIHRLTQSDPTDFYVMGYNHPLQEILLKRLGVKDGASRDVDGTRILDGLSQLLASDAEDDGTRALGAIILENFKDRYRIRG